MTPRKDARRRHVMIKKPILQLFAEGGEGAATGETSAAAGQNASDIGTNEVGEQTSPAEDSDKEYADFKSKYKARLNSETEAVIKARLSKLKASEKALNAKIKSQSSIIDAVSKRYGKASDDYDGMLLAFDEDASYISDEAMRRGVSEDTIRQELKINREMNKLNAEKADFEAAKAEEAKQREAAERFGKWLDEAESLKDLYPNIDLEEEFRNPLFVRWLEAGSSVKDTYEFVHREEITRTAFQKGAQIGAGMVSNAVAANKARATENGVGGSIAVGVSPDISKMSLAQLEEYAQRAKNGEKIDFKNRF